MKTAVAVFAVAAFAHAEPLMEKQLLFDVASVKGWSPAESTIEVTSARAKIHPTAWHWHVTVDHHGGEAKYPIGWPRVGRAIPEGPLRDWSDWDFLHMWIYTASSRATLPRDPVGLGLHAPDRANAYSVRLSELQLNEWVEIKIPITNIPRPNDVRSIQFHISEADYRHGDKLDLFIDDLALLRYAQPTILDFAAENAVMFADAPTAAVRFRLSGVKHGESARVVCELRHAGAIVAQTVAQLGRGSHRLRLDLVGRKLTPGCYELAARARDGQETTVSMRFVESPWK